VDGVWATKSEGVVILIHQRYRQTDGQTEDMQSQYRTLHYGASSGKNKTATSLKRNIRFTLCMNTSMPCPLPL